MSGATARVVLDLPVEVFSALRRSPDEFGHEMRIAAAIYWYTRSEVSMEKAATIAGLSRKEFIVDLGRRGIDVFQVDFDDLERELGRG